VGAFEACLPACLPACFLAYSVQRATFIMENTVMLCCCVVVPLLLLLLLLLLHLLLLSCQSTQCLWFHINTVCSSNVLFIYKYK
jgi:hypothetical protein